MYRFTRESIRKGIRVAMDELEQRRGRKVPKAEMLALLTGIYESLERVENTAYDENPLPQKGTIMEITMSRTSAYTLMAVGVVGAVTIFALNRRLGTLETVIRTQRSSINVYRRSLYRAGTMMNLPQLLGLVDDTLNDIKFDSIVKNV